MFNLGALDVIIALVVVLLVLSLVVQSLQQLIKKVLKLKSNTIESSLNDLFDRVVTPIESGVESSDAPTGNPPPKKTVLRGAFRRLFSRTPDGSFAAEVINEFKLLGRRTLFNNPMLDSIAKDDVVKVLAKIGAAKLYPSYQAKFQQVKEVLDATLVMLKESRAAVLTGSASAKIAALEEALTPLVYDLTALSEGKEVKATAVLGDLLNIRRIRTNDLFALLAEVQDRVQADLAAAKAAGQPTDGLEKAAKALVIATDSLRQLGDKVEDAITPLAAKVNQIELWYDTVMQGFDERYTRHMKSIAVWIAVVTVIALNANFFTMYHTIANDSKLQQSLSNLGQQLEKNKQTPPAPANGGAPQASDRGGVQEQGEDAQGTSREDLQRAIQDVEQRAQEFEALGFSRLNRDDIETFWYQTAPWGPEKDRLEWGAWLGTGMNTLAGWLITILLLSAGAPFWEDVLESLFGLKGLVRQKTATRNVEEGSGGQAKP